MPLLIFVLVAVLCLALIGFACVCLSDQFAQAFGALQTPMAVTEAWSAMSVIPLASLSLIVLSIRATGRASPAVLQRFLF
jgi:hypothetical protein